MFLKDNRSILVVTLKALSKLTGLSDKRDLPSGQFILASFSCCFSLAGDSSYLFTSVQLENGYTFTGHFIIQGNCISAVKKINLDLPMYFMAKI